VLSEAGINNQCDTIAEKMSLVDVLREVVGIRTASTSTLYECRHCGTTLPADTEMSHLWWRGRRLLPVLGAFVQSAQLVVGTVSVR